MAGFFIIETILINHHKIQSEEAINIGVGKYIISNGRYGLEAPTTIFPLFLLPFLGSNIKVLQLIMILVSILIIYLTYKIGLMIFSEKIALISIILLCITPLFFYSGYMIVGTLLSTLFGLVAIYNFINQKIIYSALFSSLAFLIYPLHFVIIISMLLLLEDKNKIKNFFLVLLLVTLIIFGFQLYNRFKFKLGYGDSMIKLLENNPLLIFSLCGIVFSTRKNYVVSIPLILYMFFFIFGASLVILPFISIMSAYGIFILFSLMKKQEIKYVLLLLFSIVIILSLLLTIEKSFHLYEVYNFGPDEDYYKFFLNKKGLILTFDPRHVIYSNNRFMFSSKIEEAIKLYKKHNFSYIVYMDLACKNSECLRKKRWFFNEISYNNELVFVKRFVDDVYYIYKAKSSK